MLLKNLSKRERTIAIIAAALVAIAVIYSFVIDPVAKRWAIMNGEMVSKTSVLANDLRMISQKASIEAEYGKLSKYIRSGKSDDETAAQALADIENLSRSDSCTVLNIKPVGIKDAGQYKEALIDLTSEADMAKFSKFIYDIENTRDGILKIKRFVLTATAGQAGTLRGSFLISKIIVD